MDLVDLFLGFLGHWLLFATVTGPFGLFGFGLGLGLGTTLYSSVLTLSDLWANIGVVLGHGSAREGGY